MSGIHVYVSRGTDTPTGDIPRGLPQQAQMGVQWDGKPLGALPPSCVLNFLRGYTLLFFTKRIDFESIRKLLLRFPSPRLHYRMLGILQRTAIASAHRSRQHRFEPNERREATGKM